MCAYRIEDKKTVVIKLVLDKVIYICLSLPISMVASIMSLGVLTIPFSSLSLAIPVIGRYRMPSVEYIWRP